MHQKILNCFTNHENLVLKYLTIVLQLYLRLNKKGKCGEGPKIFISKQMLQTFSKVFTQFKEGNASENLVNEK